MSSRLTRILIIAALLIIPQLLIRAGEVPIWLSGRPDTQWYLEREKIYNLIFDSTTQDFGEDVNKNEFARLRVINAVNKAVEDWLKNKANVYHAQLTYMSFGPEQPTHITFHLEGKTIEALLTD